MKRALISACISLGLVCGAYAQKFEHLTPYEESVIGATINATGTYDALRNVHRYWVQESMRLKNPNYDFSLCGNNDAVLKVTIPSRVIFQQGDTLFSAQAEGLLHPFLRYLREDNAVATVVVVCYSDNNGSDRYLTFMTQSRADAIGRWLQKKGVNTGDITIVGMGNNVPRTDNSNIAMREANRRVSLYLVPNKRMLKQARKGTLPSN